MELQGRSLRIETRDSQLHFGIRSISWWVYRSTWPQLTTQEVMVRARTQIGQWNRFCESLWITDRRTGQKSSPQSSMRSTTPSIPLQALPLSSWTLEWILVPISTSYWIRWKQARVLEETTRQLHSFWKIWRKTCNWQGMSWRKRMRRMRNSMTRRELAELTLL